MDTRNPAAVETEVQKAYLSMFPSVDCTFVPRLFEWAVRCFEGRYEDYQAIDARYHDFEHTLQGTLCLARMLEGHQAQGQQPVLSERIVRLAIAAILLHDTGYLKKADDVEGTGAKYTLTHVHRSAEFAARLLGQHGFSATDIRSVQNMIRCTGVNVDLASIPFQTEEERMAGFALGSADLLGQMAASDYIDKLPILFEEFSESAAHNGGKMTAAGNFASARDLMLKTPAFWEKYVQPKLRRDFLGVFEGLADAAGVNWYLDRINENISELRERLGASRPEPALSC